MRTLRLLLVVGLMSAVVFARTFDHSEFWHQVQKLAHPTVFALAAVLLLGVLRADARRAAARHYLLAFSGALLLGVLTEIAQYYVGRDPAFMDVVRDAIGALTGLAVHAACAARGATRAWHTTVAAVTSSVLLAPFAWCVAAYVHRDLGYPVVLRFGTTLDTYFVRPIGAELRVADATDDGGEAREPVLGVLLSGAPNEGVELREPHPDWRGRRVLAIGIANPGRAPLHLAIRIEDRDHDQSYDDRFNREFDLPAQARTVLRIPLADIESAPRNRRLELDRIARLVIFRPVGGSPRAFHLQRIWLE